MIPPLLSQREMMRRTAHVSLLMPQCSKQDTSLPMAEEESQAKKENQAKESGSPSSNRNGFTPRILDEATYRKKLAALRPVYDPKESNYPKEIDELEDRYDYHRSNHNTEKIGFLCSVVSYDRHFVDGFEDKAVLENILGQRRKNILGRKERTLGLGSGIIH